MTVEITEPGAFLAAVPALSLRHTPHQIAVLAAFDHRSSLSRPLLLDDVHRDTDAVQLARRMIRRLPSSHRHAVAIAVITDRPRDDVVAALQRVAAVAGIEVLAAVAARSTSPGTWWTCRCGSARCAGEGRVPEPLSSAAAPHGRPDTGADVLAGHLEPVPDDVLARREAMLDAAPDPSPIRSDGSGPSRPCSARVRARSDRPD